MDFRIGQGYDVHRLAEGETLWLGGVLIPHSKGTVAHSDGDVLIHAICDAMLGALKLRDIGTHFPDTAAEFKNIDSKILMKKSYELVKQKGYEIVNIDSTVQAQQPKLKPHIPAMEQCMADVLEIDVDRVSVKATTTETLGFEGREEGMSVNAVVLLKRM
ncbi:2-C-methyl-D-erythritol 2,4-cyclodiphosphate synthase [Draconibacterium sediminis]|uniref:2-C-methyl-D-erythritol 2,4-cyclodiphosphate synthase n=1 Tax=Draconibacterium sediminis TaxID=1544798 RepID=A0A0D8JCK3_9BACT|nr:2-C-methyl-D-erythritol 2,4-cyclodiphosphate synthase [Draconibacterium sediminis]KJF44677.1 2-C-methyl-D-erythritol 2,4-cyclodiphosphate synthase [Draconibacterium sediminis]